MPGRQARGIFRVNVGCACVQADMWPRLGRQVRESELGSPAKTVTRRGAGKEGAAGGRGSATPEEIAEVGARKPGACCSPCGGFCTSDKPGPALVCMQSPFIIILLRSSVCAICEAKPVVQCRRAGLCRRSRTTRRTSSRPRTRQAPRRRTRASQSSMGTGRRMHGCRPGRRMARCLRTTAAT